MTGGRMRAGTLGVGLDACVFDGCRIGYVAVHYDSVLVWAFGCVKLSLYPLQLRLLEMMPL